MKRLIFLLFGIAALGLGIFIIVSGNGLAKRCTEETVATIVNVVKEESTDTEGFTQHSYYPVIEYTVDDKTVSKQDGRSSSSPSEYKIGDKIFVMYNPNNVEEYMIKGDNGSTVGGIIFICFGVIIILVGVKKILLGR